MLGKKHVWHLRLSEVEDAEVTEATRRISASCYQALGIGITNASQSMHNRFQIFRHYIVKNDKINWLMKRTHLKEFSVGLVSTESILTRLIHKEGYRVAPFFVSRHGTTFVVFSCIVPKYLRPANTCNNFLLCNRYCGGDREQLCNACFNCPSKPVILCWTS